MTSLGELLDALKLCLKLKTTRAGSFATVFERCAYPKDHLGPHSWEGSGVSEPDQDRTLTRGDTMGDPHDARTASEG